MRILLYLFFLTALLSQTACISIVRPGEVGVKQRLGKLRARTYQPGLYTINPFTTVMLKPPTRTINLTLTLEALPSKEGLNVETEMAILYHMQPESAHKVISTIGLSKAADMLSSVARSVSADVTSRYFAKDMHSIERHHIEMAITEDMARILGDRGLVVEKVLLKTIKLPRGLSEAIEVKLESEQKAQQMEFVLKRERMEAERKTIEAEGVKNANKLMSESLNDLIIKYKAIEAFRELSTSPNAKTIIMNGNNPYIVSPDK